jgi:Zn-dependent protease with chaperone function
VVKSLGRHFLILVLISALIIPVGCSTGRKPLPKRTLAPEVLNPLLQETRKSYEELFEEATRPRYTSSQIEKMKTYLDQSKDYCVSSYKGRTREYERELYNASTDLYRVGGPLDEGERHERHCQIQNLRILQARSEILSEQAIPVAYENRKAKIELLERWPSEYREMQNELASGAYRNRRWANVRDIGYRVVAENQQDDVKTGLEAIQQLRQQGAMPEELDDPTVRRYVSQLAENLAKHSDLQVPVKVKVLNSKEINAFALPGGFLFVQRGLIEAAENESQLAGVISHEIAHDAARHGHKLMRKANIANILLQAAQIASLFAGSPGTYYALRYGAMGLGLALNLNILGKSRDFELEADQLGIQYAWNAGYDPRGFFQFFDRMATEKGYVTGASWFRTHPPFYERMVSTRKEILFIGGPRKDAIKDSDEFHRVQEILKDYPVPLERMDQQNSRQRERYIPIRAEGCPAPVETQANAGVQYLEDICRLGAEEDLREER